MARKILCPKCNEKLAELAKKYRELYESVEGKSKERFRCDDCDAEIKVNDVCFAAVILPSKHHSQYEHQKPSAWMGNLITPTA